MIDPDKCPKCNRTIEIGDFPWCPHGKGVNRVHDDTIIGGETCENLGHKPVTFYSKSEKRRYLKEHGIEEFVRHVGTQGSDKSPHTTRWI